MSNISAQESDAVRLAAMLRGHVVTQLLASAVRLKIPDLLGDRILTDVQLGELTGIGITELRRYLQALQGLALVEPAGPHQYRGTPMASLLRSDTGSLYGQALMAGGEYYAAWSDLDYALRTGTSAFEHVHGSTLWARFAGDGDAAAHFSRTMRWNTERILPELISLYDFPDTGIVADLGGGDGTLVAGLLGHYPRLRGMIVEQSAVIDCAYRTIEQHGFTSRCEFVAADILHHIPTGADLYVLKSVIHNWDDTSAMQILRNCRSAAKPGGRLLLVERAMNTDDPLDAAVRDLTMLVLFGSRDRTAEEYGSLLADSGFAVEHIAVTQSGYHLLEGIA
jgi:orsellinic acid C2-O-methyltransferase